MPASPPLTSSVASASEGAEAAQAEPLIARRCSRCKRVSFPPRERCPVCWSEAGEPLQLGPTGIIHTFTTVYAARPGEPTPYTIAYVDLGPVRIFARVLGEPRVDSTGLVTTISEPENPVPVRYLIDLREENGGG